MADNSLTEKELRRQVEFSDDLDWEESCYRYGCEIARQEAVKRLQAIEERLHKSRPKGWKDKGFHRRTLVTRFGEVTILRRLYQDQEEKYHFLLDEYLNLPSYQSATATLTESMLELASQVSFRQAASTLEKLTGGVLSSMTIHRLLQKVAEGRIQEERRNWQACYEDGKLTESQGKKVDWLYIEADGIWVSLQREKKSHYELRNGIAYEGYQKLSCREERYALLNKWVYCHSDDVSFWEASSLEWDRIWDLGSLKGVVIGGDGAGWIDEGLGWFGSDIAIRQLDGFHLARACRWGWNRTGREIYQAIRQGEVEEAKFLISQARERGPEKKLQGQRGRSYIQRHLLDGMDWRKKLKSMEVPEGARGLGTIESNEDKLFADRLKKRGMSWKIRGAQRMGEIIPSCFSSLGKSDWGFTLSLISTKLIQIHIEPVHALL